MVYIGIIKYYDILALLTIIYKPA